MLKSLKLHGVGPVKDLTATLGERLNVLTGDNGLGKSFFLDVAFWALTGTWPGGRVALPKLNGTKHEATIAYEVEGKKKAGKQTATFDYAIQSWRRERGRPPIPGLVLYAAVDGGFAVWDPARNYWRDTPTGQVVPAEQPRAYQFARETLANKLEEDGRVLCNGLIYDWGNWYYRSLGTDTANDSPFELLREVVAELAHPEEPMTIIAPLRVYVDDSREFPAVQMPYGPVAYPHFSAGVRRIVSLAYLLVWAWDEHTRAAQARGEEPTNRLVLLVDEIEAHLHPKWQRVILPALMTVAEGLKAKIAVQVLTATHSPLVLASLEPIFDEEKDCLFWFDLQDGVVHFKPYPWSKHGDADSWLTSDIFGLKRARSKAAEDVIEAAEKFMAGRQGDLPGNLNTKEKIQQEMVRVLPGVDPIWPRWRAKTGRRAAP